MRLLFIVFAGLVGYWLGFYYGASLGYTVLPDSDWFGAVFSYLVGAPLGAFAAVWLARKASYRFRK